MENRCKFYMNSTTEIKESIFMNVAITELEAFEVQKAVNNTPIERLVPITPSVQISETQTMSADTFLMNLEFALEDVEEEQKKQLKEKKSKGCC